MEEEDGRIDGGGTEFGLCGRGTLLVAQGGRDARLRVGGRIYLEA